MKLKEFNAETCVNERKYFSVPSVAINMKTGLFRFNHEAVKLLELADGDQVMFLQDEGEPENWYVERVKDKGFVVRHKETVGKGVLFNNSQLARLIAESVLFTGLSGRCLIAGEPTEFKKRRLWGVLTATMKNKMKVA